MRLIAVALVSLLMPLASAQDLQARTVVSGLNGPVDFAVLPGELWYVQYYTGEVIRHDLETGETEVMFTTEPMPLPRDERGLVGLAVNEKTAAAGRFFIYYTVPDPDDPDGGTNRLSRIDNGHEKVLLTTTASFRHNGGRILIAPDETLFVATGDNNLGMTAQDLASPLGKILHVDQDGKGVAGNVQGPVYSFGHRNVYGLALDPATGRLFATENGNAERDEVNEIVAGANYGWPECEGHVRYDKARERDTNEPCDDPSYTAPIGEFYKEGTAAPTGAAILHGVLYWASWNEGAIHRLTQQDDGSWQDDVIFRPGGRINDLEAAPDGSGLYYSNWTHIMRVELPVGQVKPLGPTATEDGQDSPLPLWLFAGLLLVAARRKGR